MRPDLPPGRYDRPRRRDRVLAGLAAGILAASALIGGYLLYSRHQAGQLDGEVTAFTVQSDTVLRISFQVVTRGHRGECEVQARDHVGTPLGSRLVEISPNGSRSQVETVDVQTQRRAATGELVGCRRR